MGKFYRINQFIQAKEVRVVDEKGNQIGVLPIFNAIQKAKEEGKDLVEVAANAKPPVAKIIDFKKFKYLEAKKEKEEKKGKKGGGTKEVLFTPFIAQNDINTRIKKIRGFLKDGDKVKLRILFKGREMTKRDFGYKIIDLIMEELAQEATKEQEAKFQGRELFVILSSKKGGVKNEN